jgi:hypothetical protein
MQRRNISNEAGGRADGMMIVSIIFFATLAYIALTTSPVYTGVGVGDRAPELQGEVWDGTTWTSFNLHDTFDENWEEDSGEGTWYMIEFMDTNCGACQSAATKTFPEMQSKWLEPKGQNGRSVPANTTVEFLAVSIALHPDSWAYGPEEIKSFIVDYNQEFPFMDDHDNSNRDVWEIPGTPSYFLIAPNGIIQYASPEDTSQTVWDVMESKIPRGEA